MATHPLVSQIVISATDTPLTQDFNSMAVTGTSGTMPAGWVFLETGAGSNALYTANDGSLSTEDTYSYGSTSAADRALGQINSTITSLIGASFTNSTGATITSVLVQYTGEQWRLGATGRVDRLDFQYSINATAINNGTWTDLDALDFIAPVTSGTIGALDGNLTANRTLVGSLVTGISIANGTTFWIRWNPLNPAGSDDGLAIDDFILSANPALHYQISTVASNLIVTDIDGNGETISITEAGSNIQFYALGRTYSFNGGTITPLPFQTSIAGVNTITCSAGAGADTIEVGAFTTSMKDFALNGGINDDVINLNGDLSFAANEILNIDLQNDAASPGTDQINVAVNANIILSGSGSATFRASRNIVLNSGSSLITANGNIIMEANLQASPTAGSFIGINVAGGSVQSTGSGLLTIEGKGGTSAGNMHGISVNAGGDIIGGTSGSVSLTGRAGLAASSTNMGVMVTGTGSTITSGGSNVIVEGFGSASGSLNFGVQVASGGMISAGGMGSVTVQGTGGLVSTVTNDGVRVTGTNSTITSSGGNVSVTGFGGGTASASTNPGVNVSTNGKITAGGTGTVTITGTGGNTTGVNNLGVQVSGANALITSGGGNVLVTGMGGGTSATTNGYGVFVSSGGTITAGSSGTVTVNGTGSLTIGNNHHGIFLNGSTSSITSGGGHVTLNGTGGGTGTSTTCAGVNMVSGVVSAGGNGNVTLTGTGGPGSAANNIGFSISGAGASVTSAGGDISIFGIEGGGPSGYGIVTTAPAEITTLPNGGGILFIGNSMSMNAPINTQSIDFISMRPYTNGTPINLGSVGDIVGGPLQISDQELDSMSTGTIYFGNTSTGQVTTTADITRSASTLISIFSSDAIVIDDGIINTSGGNLYLDPGPAPDAVEPLAPATEIFCGTLSFGGPLEFNIDGLVPDVSYTQLNVSGAINLSNSSLQFTGSYVPFGGETFTIINNDGAEAITNQFPGLPQGATITLFLGSPYPATISYTGGTGNDVVITVANPDYLITTAGNQFILNDLAGNGDNLTISEVAGNLNLAIAGRTFSLNGGAMTSFPASVSLAGLTSLTFNTGQGNDQNIFQAFTTTLPNLTFNGGLDNDVIIFIGDINFTPNAFLNLDLQNDDPMPGTDQVILASNVNLKLFGTGSCTIKVSKNVELSTNASIETVNGNLTIEANQQATSSSGSFIGLLSSGLIQVTGTGVLSIHARGGMSGSGNHGLQVTLTDILGGTTGTTTIVGTGGINGGGISHGILLNGNGCSISTLGSHLDVSGSSDAAAGGNYGVYLINQALISAGGNGKVTVNGSGGSVGSNNVGIHLAGSSITSANGDIEINGEVVNSSAGSQNYGVFLSFASIIQAGGVGIVEVNGSGGLSSGNNNIGVTVANTGSSISSSGGNVSVTGQGGGAANSASNYGVYLLAGGVVSAGASGNVSVIGTGGLANGSSNQGVRLDATGTMITSSGGNVSVNGTGGGTAGALNVGVLVKGSAMITSGGTGMVTVIGNGGFTLGGFNSGVVVQESNSTITSSGGHVIVTGQGGGTTSSALNLGVLVSMSGKITAGGTGNVSVTGNGGIDGTSNFGVQVSGTGSAIFSDGGDILITATGGGNSTSSFGYGLEVSAAGMITSTNTADITIFANGGPSTTSTQYGFYLEGPVSGVQSVDGNIAITANGGPNSGGFSAGLFMYFSDIKSTGIGNISIQANGSTGTGNSNQGIFATNAMIRSHDGNINLIVNGGGSLSTGQNMGLFFDSGSSVVSDGSGNILIHANGGNTNGGGNSGIVMTGLSGGIYTTSGNIDIIATGHGAGAGAGNTGMTLTAGANILAGGMGNITIEGTGGLGSGQNHFGMYVAGESTIATLHGDVNVTGAGGGSGLSSFNYGVSLYSGAKVLSAGNGNVTVEGTGGGEAGADFNHGVLLFGDSATIASSAGIVSVTGFGGGSGTTSDNNYGVFLFDKGHIKVGQDGAILVQGTGGQGSGFNNIGVALNVNQNLILGGGPIVINGIEGGGVGGFGFFADSDATITTDSLGGNITLVANSMLTLATIETPDSNMVTLRPHTSGVSIYVGGTSETIGGPLRLSDPELDYIHTGHLRIGHAQTDSVLVITDITRSDTLDITLLAGGDIVLDTGAVMMTSGNLLLDCGPSPKAIMPLTHDTEIETDTLSFGSDLLFNINGIIPDSLHDQLHIKGVVKLTGVDLKFSGSYFPLYADTFLIVDNDSTDAIIGTFNGLAEGATIPMFLGSNTPATITYTGGDGNDVVITVSTPDYAITESAGHLVVTDLKGNADNMSVSQIGSAIRFLVTGRTYSYNYGAFTTMPADIPLSGVDSITLNLEGGNDLLTVNTFSTSLPQLSINGGTGDETISFVGDITFAPDANLIVDLQDDAPAPGTDQVIFATSTNLQLSGLGSATLKVSRSVLMNAGAGLETVNGNIHIESNQQPTPSTGIFIGIDLDGAFCKTSGMGSIALEGKGGTTSSGRHGVQVRNGSIVSCEASGMISIVGAGGASNQSSNYGVNVTGTNSIISAAGNLVSVTGTGGGLTATVDNSGIVVQSGGKISNTGLGDVMINASGSSFGGANIGMMIFGAGSGVFTSDGDINVIANANGASNTTNNLGTLIFNQGVIQSTGNGNVEVTGTGGIGSGTGQVGVSLSSLNSGIFSTHGDVTVNGNGGGSGISNASHGIRILAGAAIASTGSGHVFVNAQGGPGTGNNNSGLVMQNTDSRISSISGNITVTGTGGSTGVSGSTVGISMTSGSKINAQNNGNILLHATGGLGSGSSNYGFSVNDADILTTDGDITIQAIGGGTGGSGSNIGMSMGSAALILAGGAGQVMIEATGGPGSGFGNNGAELSNAGTLITTDGGNIQMTCTGGGASGSSNKYGLNMLSGAIVRAGGGGETHVTGFGGPGESPNNIGIQVSGANTTISSSGGNVIVNGTGGGAGAGSSSQGVYVASGGVITAGILGNVAVTGTGGPGTGTSNQGVVIINTGAAITSGGGDIEIIGIEGGGPSGVGFVTSNFGAVSTTTNGGNISIAANSMQIQSALATSTTDTFFLKPLDAGEDIQLAITGDPIGGPLQLTDAEMDFITTGTLVIGDSLSSAIRVLANVTRPAATSVWFTTGGEISFQTGSVNTQGGNLVCSPGISPAAITAPQPGVDVTVDTLRLNGICAFTVDGTAYDVTYDQLDVAGKVDVDSVNIVLSGMYVPVVGDSFMFIRNDGSDLLIGAIAGWPDGDTLNNFLGSTLDGVIDYSGGDGNDLVVHVVEPCILPGAPEIMPSADTICAGQQVTLTITGGNLGQATNWHWYANDCGMNPLGTGTAIMVTPSVTTTYFARGEGGCVVTADCGEVTIIVNPYPDATIERTAPGNCYYTTNTFQPFAAEIPGATYTWNFGGGASPATAIGYGPHDVVYTIAGPKAAKLVIYPNTPGTQCPDSSTLNFTINSCPGQILGRVESISGDPIASVNVRLYADIDVNGIADNNTALRSVFTSSSGVIAMASLTPGHYVLIETQPSGWTSFDDGDSSPDGDQAPNLDSLDNIIPVSLIPSETDSMNVFVERPTPGSISGAVFQDLDFDQTPDNGEGLSGITIRLHADANTDGVADGPTPVDTLVTASDGSYIFSDVPVGHYVIVEIQPPLYSNIKDFDQSNDMDQVPNTNMLNDTIPVTITNGETDGENYFIDSPTCGSVVTNTNDSGPGSMRELLGCAQSGDTIRFHPSLAGMAIEINSGVIAFSQEVVLFSELTPRLMIASQIDGLFEIQNNAEVTFMGLDIRGGLSPGMTGSAIENEGILTLINTNVLKNPFFTSGEYLIRNMPGSQLTIAGVCLLETD